MANWIKMRVFISDDPDVIKMAKMLDTSDYAVVGMLAYLWSWATENLTDGNAASVTFVWIDRYAGVTGLAAAMESVGWLQATSGGVTFPGWDSHLSSGAKKRDQSAKRQQTLRNSNANSNAPSVTLALPDKRREDKKKKNSVAASPLELPAEIDTPAFREAWERWQQHRREKRQPMTATASRQQLKKLAAMGETRAIAAIDDSTASGYTGIFEQKTTGNTHGIALQHTRRRDEKLATEYPEDLDIPILAVPRSAGGNVAGQGGNVPSQPALRLSQPAH